MQLSIIQTLLILFLLFALSRVILRFKSAEVSLLGFFFWTVLFSLAIITTIFPFLASNLAHGIGIGRGVDIIIYVSIVILFYLIFRLYVYVQDLRHELTTLIRKLALKEKVDYESQKSSKN
jgi:small membrane protein